MDKYTILPPPSIQPEILDDYWNDKELNDSFESSGNESSGDNFTSFGNLVDSYSLSKDCNTISSSW